MDWVIGRHRAWLVHTEAVRVNGQDDAETVSVLVAKADIPQGMLGSQVVAQKMLTTQEIPRKAIVNGTIATPEDISGLIATQPIYIGEQVTARRFGPLEAAGVRDQLRGTYRVMQIKGNDAQLLSGVLRPGDRASGSLRALTPSAVATCEQSAYEAIAGD